MDFKHLKKSTTQDKAHMNRSLHSNPENIGANNHIPKPHITTPPNIINIQIGTVMGPFNPIPSTNFPIPNQFRTTPTGPVLNSPQPFCKFPSSQPFIPNRQDLLYQKFGNCIPNHTSFANDMKPNNPIFAQSRENETKESEPHSISANTPNESWVKTNLSEKGCNYDPGYEAINLTNSSKLPPSQRVGRGHMPSIAELNKLRRLLTNRSGEVTLVAKQHRMIVENHKQIEKSVQMLSELTSRVDKPNNPIFAQSRENETKESEPHSISAKPPNESWVKTNLNEKSCTYDPGYEAINLTNSSKLPPSQRVGKGHMPSIAELNDLRRVVTNIGRGLTSIAEQHRMILENHKQLEKSHQMLSEHTMVLHDTMLRQQMQMTRHIFKMSKYMYAFMRMQQASSSTPSQQPFHSTPNSQCANENEDDNEDDAEDGDEHKDKVEHATPLGRH